MNILSIGSKYKPYNGGNAKRVSIMCENFAKLGHKVVVITESDKGIFNDEKYTKETGITVLRYSNQYSFLTQIKKIIKKYNIDIIYTHNIRAILLCSLFAPKNVKLVIEFHALSLSSSLKEYLKRLSITLIRKKTKAIFVLSKNAKKILTEKYNFEEEIIHIAPNGIDDKNVSSLIFGENNEFVYAYGGTLYDWQGINVLMSKSKEIINISDDVVLKIIGGGPLLDEVKSFVVNEKLQDSIIITGFLEEKDFNTELSKADVILIPRPSMQSTESAIPLKIFDAIKVNKPIIMSNVSGLTEVLQETEALIYKHDDINGLVDCCRKIYRNKSLAEKMTKASQEKLKSWPTNIEIAEYQVKIMNDL